MRKIVELIEDNLVQAGVRPRDWPARDSLLPSVPRSPFIYLSKGHDFSSYSVIGEKIRDFQ